MMIVSEVNEVNEVNLVNEVNEVKEVKVSSRERLILRLSLILQRAFCSSDTESVQKS